ncbi:hypothetical protein ACOMHN_017196 [Nucella lapillus]
MNIIDPAALRFDANHGSNVVLSNDGQTAERIRGHDNAIVVCRYPLLINRVFEVRLDKKDPTDGDYQWLNGKQYMCVGVAIEAPSILSLPGEANEWGYAVVINNSHVTLKGQYLTGNEVGRCLENLAQGSTVGLSMDHQDCLRLYVNGRDEGVALRLAVPFPLYAFFELIGPYRKVCDDECMVDYRDR